MVRTLTVLVWAAVAGSATFWVWKLAALAAPALDQPLEETRAAPGLGDLSPLLGGSLQPSRGLTTLAASERDRFQLMGVIAEAALVSAGDGLALIAVDGERARAYRVGAMLDATWVLHAVQSGAVTLATRQGEATIVIELPPWPLAAAGGRRQISATERDPGSKALAPASAGSPSVARLGPGAPTSGQDRAPNTLLNNPAEMTPADASDIAGQPRQ